MAGYGGAREGTGPKPKYHTGTADTQIRVPAVIKDAVLEAIAEIDRKEYDRLIAEGVIKPKEN